MNESEPNRSTDDERRPYKLILIGLMLLVLLGVGAYAFFESREEDSFVDLIQEVPDQLEIYGTVPPDVEFTERTGEAIKLGDLRGKAWVASFIFTRCRGTCPIMTSSLQSIQDRLEEIEIPIRLVSITVDPEYDDHEVLSGYAEDYEARDSWLFLTGPDSVVQSLAMDVFKLAIAEGTDPEEPIIHSSRFVLVDESGRIRGYFEGTTEEGVEQLMKGIRRLEEERGN